MVFLLFIIFDFLFPFKDLKDFSFFENFIIFLFCYIRFSRTFCVVKLISLDKFLLNEKLC